MSGVSERVDRRAGGPVLYSLFLIDLTHCGVTEDGRDFDVVIPRATHHVVLAPRLLHHHPRHFARNVSGEIGISVILQMTNILCRVVENVHVARLVHPQLAHDDVVNRRRY